MTADTSGVFLILLAAGHLIGDFALQTETMVRSKRTGGVMLAHVGGVTAAHLIALAPLLSWAVVLVVLGVAASHGAIDLWKVRQRGPRPGPLALFVLDQAAHVSMLVVVWTGFLYWAGPPRSLLAPPFLETFTASATIAAAIVFNAVGGAAIVSAVLGEKDSVPTGSLPGVAGARVAGARVPGPSSAAVGQAGAEDTAAIGGGAGGAIPAGGGPAGTGRLIGILERTLSLVLILVGEWATIGILIAAKSIARFDELKERRFSEYYLIGTLTSLLVAIVTGLLLRAALRWI